MSSQYSALAHTADIGIQLKKNAVRSQRNVRTWTFTNVFKIIPSFVPIGEGKFDASDGLFFKSLLSMLKRISLVWLLLMQSHFCYAPDDKIESPINFKIIIQESTEFLPKEDEKVVASLTGKHYRISPFHVCFTFLNNNLLLNARKHFFLN